MGRVWSGTWSRQNTKIVTENCLSFSVQDLLGRGHSSQYGRIKWRWPSGREYCINYSINRRGGLPIVTLNYPTRDNERVSMLVRTETTNVHFGGERLWFTCPLIVNGVRCNRRVGKLYLPPCTKYFGCRLCHDLSYRSSQAAHQADRGTGTAAWLERGLAALKRRNR